MNVQSETAIAPADLATICERAMRTAAEALARLLSARADAVTVSHRAWRNGIAVPRPGCAIAFEVSGVVSGRLIHILGDEDVMGTAGPLVRTALVDPQALTMSQRGALAEMGNIVVSAFLNELSSAFGGSCLPSVPQLVAGADTVHVEGWLTKALAHAGDTHAMLLRAELDHGHGPGFTFAFAPTV